MPCAAAVTATVIVQLAAAGMLMPGKWSEVAPAANELGVVPVQVPVTAAALALMLMSVSRNAPPVCGTPVGLLSVYTMVVVPPETIVLPVKILLMLMRPTPR